MKCCLCGKIFKGVGNNPDGALTLENKRIKWSKKDRCCDECNKEVVIPGRILKYVTNRTN